MQSPIVPVTVFPGTADTLIVDSFYGFPPTYRWALAKATTVNGQTTYTTLSQGNGSFTQEHWDAWTNQPDDSYPLQVAAANLGVTLK